MSEYFMNAEGIVNRWKHIGPASVLFLSATKSIVGINRLSRSDILAIDLALAMHIQYVAKAISMG
jgi:hypothetical protein